MLLVAVTVALVVTLRSAPSDADQARSEQVRATLTAYLGAATNHRGAAACDLLTPVAQQTLLVRSVALNGAPITSCQGYFADLAARDAASGRAPVVFPVVVDHVGTETATAHEQGSSMRTTLVATKDGWRIQGWSVGPPSSTPSDPIWSRLFFAAAFLSSSALGLCGARWRWIAILPILFLIVGVLAVANEPDGYDMPGFGYLVGIGYALFCLVLSVAGRAIRIVARAMARRLQRP